MTVKVGLDLGYANFTVSDVSAGIFREPSVALVDQNSHQILAVGSAASESGDWADDIPAAGAILVRPFKNGILYSSDLTQEMIDHVMKVFRAGENKVRCFVGIPSDFVPKQTAVLLSMVQKAGADEVYAVKRSMAALIGAGYSPTISAISVNVGASRTEIMTLCGGRILAAVSAPIGGEDFDKAVKKFVSEQGDFNISLSVARAIKEKLGAVWEGKTSESLTIDGTLSLTGNKVRMTIATEDILDVFREPLAAFIGAVADVVKRIPSEDVDAVFHNGIILTGGGAELYGLDKMLSHVLGIRVTSPQAPIDSVAKGLSRIGTFLPSGLRSGREITDRLAKYYEAKKQN